MALQVASGNSPARRFAHTLRLLTVFVFVALAPSLLRAELIVFLDYTNFSTRLATVTTNAGIDPFSGAEQDQLQANILTRLETVYSAFDITFTTVNPGGSFETISFGLTDPTPGNLGLADSIDYRNQVSNQLARVFTANFDFFVDEFSGSTNRSTQIAQLSAALGNTAAHELGHNLGLQHHEAYSNFTYAGGELITDGSQNTSMMSTGSTGASEASFEQNVTLSKSAIHKLEFASGLLSNTPAVTNEQVGAHGTTGTAQTVGLVTLPVSGSLGANIVAEIDVADEVDVYRFFAYANSLLSAYIASSVALDPNGFDAIMRLYDIDGSTELAFNDDSRYSGNSFGDVLQQGSQEPSFFNILLPTSGFYFLEIAGFDNTQFGNYELLIALDITGATIPEPSSFVLLTVALAGVYVVHRRRRGRQGDQVAT